jgi:hypothetical protein
MVRFVLVGIALAFSLLTAASADILPRPATRTQDPVRCMCVRAPCDCERYERDLDRQRGKPVAFSHCTGADHKLVQVGTREFCGYTEVSCLQSKTDTPREYTEVTLPSAYCARPANSECPRPRDLTDCVNSDDVSERDGKLIAQGLKEARVKANCEASSTTVAAPAPSSRPSTPARRTQ